MARCASQSCGAAGNGHGAAAAAAQPLLASELKVGCVGARWCRAVPLGWQRAQQQGGSAGVARCPSGGNGRSSQGQQHRRHSLVLSLSQCGQGEEGGTLQIGPPSPFVSVTDRRALRHSQLLSPQRFGVCAGRGSASWWCLNIRQQHDEPRRHGPIYTSKRNLASRSSESTPNPGDK